MTDDFIGNTGHTVQWTLAADYVYATRFQASSDFDAISMAVHIDKTQSAGDYQKLAIYADSSGSPSTLLGVSNELEADYSESWQIAFLTSSVAISSGNYYWLAVLQNNQGNVRGTNGTLDVVRTLNSNAYSSGFPDPFGTTTTSNAEAGIVASDGIYVQTSDRLIHLEASDGTKILVAGNNRSSDQDALFVIKGLEEGGSPSVVAKVLYETILGGGSISISNFDAAIDSNDNVHVIAAASFETADYDVAYGVCDLSTGFGTWEEAAEYNEFEAASSNKRAVISIDSNNKPHILYVNLVKQTGSSQNNIYYANKVGASWSTPEQVGKRVVKTDIYSYPSISHAPNDDVEAIYYFQTATDPAFKRRNSTWSAEQVYNASAGIPGSVTVTSGDTVYRYHLESDYSRENDVSTGYISAGYPHATLYGTDRYIFYIDFDYDIHLISNSGSGWTDEGELKGGTVNVSGVYPQHSYNNNRANAELSYAYGRNFFAFWDIFVLEAPSTKVPVLMDYYRRRRVAA